MSQPWSHQIWAASGTYTTACGNTGSFTHCVRPGIKPASSWILVRFLTHRATTGPRNFRTVIIDGTSSASLELEPDGFTAVEPPVVCRDPSEMLWQSQREINSLLSHPGWRGHRIPGPKAHMPPDFGLMWQWPRNSSSFSPEISDSTLLSGCGEGWPRKMSRQSSALTRGWGQCPFPPAGLAHPVIHGAPGKVFTNIFPRKWG